MDDQPVEPASVPEKSGSGSWWSHWAKRLRASGWKGKLTGVSTLIGIMTGLVTLFDPFHGACRMIDICDEPATTPSDLGATLSEIVVGGPLTLAEAYGDYNLSVSGDLMPHQDWPGRLVTYRIEFRGMAGETCLVRWTLYDHESGGRIPNDTSVWKTIDAPARPYDTLEAEARTDAANGSIWIPNVASGTFDVEIEILDDEANLVLDRKRTPSFPVLARDVPSAPTTSRPDTFAWNPVARAGSITGDDGLSPGGDSPNQAVLTPDDSDAAAPGDQRMAPVDPTPTLLPIIIIQGTSELPVINTEVTDESSTAPPATSTPTEVVVIDPTPTFTNPEETPAPPTFSPPATRDPTVEPTATVEPPEQPGIGLDLGIGALVVLSIGLGIVLLKRRSAR